VRWKKVALIILGTLIGVYLLLVGALFAAMRRPPEQFSRVMSYVPMPAFLILPFKSLWLAAREGSLQIGDPAPDFDLPLVDGSGKVRLSSFRGEKPVVLVFGSYT
jgi:hypothetical protein